MKDSMDGNSGVHMASGSGTPRKRHAVTSTTRDVTRQNDNRLDETPVSAQPAAVAPRSDGHPRQLLAWDQVPLWYSQTDRIRTGFRPVTDSVWECMVSLTYLHNESVNIYTHLVPGLVSLVAVISTGAMYLGVGIEDARRLVYGSNYSTYDTYHTDDVEKKKAVGATIWGYPALDVLVVGLFLCTTAMCFGISAIYHMLVCHSRVVAERWIRFDYAAIVLQIWGSFISGLYMCFYCEKGLRWGYWAMITVLSVISALIVLDARLQDLQWRMLRLGAFVVTGLSAFAPIAHGALIFPYDQMDKQSGLRWYYLEGVFMLLGAAVYATHFPESTKPFRFDIWGASHQLFHVLVVFGSVAHLYGILSALRWNADNRICQSSLM